MKYDLQFLYAPFKFLGHPFFLKGLFFLVLQTNAKIIAFLGFIVEATEARTGQSVKMLFPSRRLRNTPQAPPTASLTPCATGASPQPAGGGPAGGAQRPAGLADRQRAGLPVSPLHKPFPHSMTPLPETVGHHFFG